MSAAFYYWRGTRWRSRRQMVVVALICGLLGTVALGALAGARRTDTAYGRYLHAINSSDVLVNVPGPVLPVIRQVERLPGVASAAAIVGLNANPVVNGKVNDAWLTNGLSGSLDGEGFRQDRMTVLAGRLPRPGATDEVALTQGQAQFFHTGVGGHVTYEFYRTNLTTNASIPAGRFDVRRHRDHGPSSGARGPVRPGGQRSAPPGRHRQVPERRVRVRVGRAAAHGGQRRHPGAAAAPDRRLPTRWTGCSRCRRARSGSTSAAWTSSTMRSQQGIEPQAIALAILGGLAALALLVLAGQAMTQLLDRSTPDLAGLRAMGASRAQAALACGLAGVVAVARRARHWRWWARSRYRRWPRWARSGTFDPARGVQADPLVLAGGGCVLAAALLAVLGVLAWRSARPPGDAPAARASSVAAAAAAAGLPVSAVVGHPRARWSGAGRRPVPVLATLAGSVVAVMAVTMAVVFGASLTGLIANPARYGWNWTLLMDSQGGYESWPPAADEQARQRPARSHRLVHLRVHPDPHRRPEPARAGRCTRHLGSVEPPDHQRPPDRRAAARSSWASRPCVSSASGSGTR